MAEVKNSFLASRMNKDLDDRLIPNGEYRDARNISVGRSEDDDVGALENVLGNSEIKKAPPADEFLLLNPIPLESDRSLICIGYFMDNTHNRIYRFLTNYTDPIPIENNYPTDISTMKITVYDFNTLIYTTLVDGLFLNFSTTNIITGVNLVENLLFWTDNRNQPRKINIQSALNNSADSPSPYYTTETQISVAKYAPVDPISLYKKVIVTVINDPIPGLIFTLNDITGVEVGMTVISASSGSCDFLTITNITDDNITVSSETLGIKIGDELTLLISTMTDQADNPTWPGDPDFLEDKYVRFSYRFRYDDGEYSLMAPFTQIAFIPKQKGYFISGDETAAYRSTIISWMENNVNNIELLIPLPDKGTNISNSYKIRELDVLYKESDSLAVKVLETIPLNALLTNENVYIYTYQSQKPYKTLTEAQTIRVYDKTPVTAKAQDVSGNRIIYGNFRDSHTAPIAIDYSVSVQEKQSLYTNFIEYPNHTLKQNRNYQVGFVLSDKFGRQSSVILSTIDTSNVPTESFIFGGSTVYSPYYNDTNAPNVKCWNGNALLVLINNVISSTKNTQTGTPGLYAESLSDGSGFIITSGVVDNAGPFTYTFETLSLAEYLPKKGTYLRGEYTDFVEVMVYDDTMAPVYTVTSNQEISTIYNLSTFDPDIKYAYNINPTGWYSYKVVVRQQEQDYYNVYLPGMLNGYPSHQTYGSQVVYNTGTASLQNGINTSEFPVTEINKTAHIVLLNDNINKIPRDLSEVGPDQRQYRSSVEIYGRVENTSSILTFDNYAVVVSPTTTSIQYNAGLNPSIIAAIPGDAITCLDANVSGGLWYKNTTIVSNIVDTITNIGTIKFTPANPISVGYINFAITQGNNIQYYPSKKSDIASTIANATDLSFFQNTVNNITGSAGLNLYQLDNSPLVARISTTNSIGVDADNMVPYLSVYETKPTTTALDLFWETATTGYIADLNADVLTGFEGPSFLSKFDFLFYESQDPNGGGSGTGSANSPYITDIFVPLSPAGVSIYDLPAVLTVKDLTGVDRSINFELETIPLTGYRVKILDNYSFVFKSNASTKENYIFKIVFNDNGIESILSFNGNLSNVTPYFDLDCGDYDVTINQTDNSIVTFTGGNGAFGGSNEETKFTIAYGNESGAFSLNSNTGELTLLDHAIPGDITYSLLIKITDAVSESNPLGDLFFECPVNIRVLPAVTPPNFHRIIYGDANNVLEVFNNQYALCPGATANCFEATSYGLYYVSPYVFGTDGRGPFPTGGPYAVLRPGAPNAPGTDSKYWVSQNIEKRISGAVPTGLTTGALEWTFTLNTNSQFQSCIPNATLSNTADFLIYYRPLSVSSTNDPASWQIITDNNNVNRNNSGAIIEDWDLANENISLKLKVISGASTPTATNKADQTISFITAGAGQWAVAVRFKEKSNCYSNSIGYVSCSVTDANFTYATPTSPPVRKVQIFSTGLQSGGYPSGKPFSTQDANNAGATISKNVLTEVIASNTIELININNTIVPGMQVNDPVGPIGFVTEINVDDNPNKIKINNTVSIPAGTILNFSYTFNDSVGAVYAPTTLATDVRQFYTDAAFLNPWNPPIPGMFYRFQQHALSTNYNYQTGSVKDALQPQVTNHPFFSARFNASGQVEGAVGSTYSVQTGWKYLTPTPPPQQDLLTGRNIRQFLGP